MDFKNIILFLISCTIGLGIIEIALRGYAADKQLDALENKSQHARFRTDPKAIAFRAKYEDRLHHLRGGQVLSSENANVEDLLFTTVTPFSPSKSENILIQGDSWAEAARHDENLMANFSMKNNAGLMIAGISSFAPSPMALQLDILRKDFKYRPTVVVAIIDQTDLGDELYRYNNQKLDASNRLIGLADTGKNQKWHDFTMEREDNFLSNQFALVKVIRHLIFQIQDGLNDVSGFDILSPLINGPTIKEKSTFTSRLSRYIDYVFEDAQTEFLIIVTHPHRNHLLDEDDPEKYKGNVSVLIDDVLQQKNMPKKIIHLNLTERATGLFKTSNFNEFFVQGDRFSHLTKNIYNSFYYPEILTLLTSKIN
jgi:hypothetical protein